MITKSNSASKKEKGKATDDLKKGIRRAFYTFAILFIPMLLIVIYLSGPVTQDQTVQAAPETQGNDYQEVVEPTDAEAETMENKDLGRDVTPPSIASHPNTSETSDADGMKIRMAAERACQQAIERMANYSVRWTNRWYEDWFSTARLGLDGNIWFLGDKVEFQNGFGAWQNHAFACAYDYERGNITEIAVEPGRL